MAKFKRVADNIFRHSAGKLYLRANVSGKAVLESLDTERVEVAKVKRDARLAALRKAARKDESETQARTLGELIDHLDKFTKLPHLKTSTGEYYADLLGILRATVPTDRHPREVRPHEAAEWWHKLAKKYAPQRANNVLAWAKRLGESIVNGGHQPESPFAKLKRVPIPRKRLVVPSRDELSQIVESVREQGKRSSEVSADYVEFLAFSGLRHAEAAALQWEHIGKDWVTVYGGEEGTKNRSMRRVPISPPLRAVIDRMRKEGVSGKVFNIKSPRIALENACERLGLPHLGLHDLRHFFATYSIECGVDIPTVSKWLGHKDGGALAMRIYGHLRDDHSLASAAKLK